MNNPARRVLDLTLEYSNSSNAREAMASISGTPAGRTPDEIAADYAVALKELLAE